MCAPVLPMLMGGLLGSLLMRPKAQPMTQQTSIFEKVMNQEPDAKPADDLTPLTGNEGIAKTKERKAKKVSTTGALKTKAPKQIGLGTGGRQPLNPTGVSTGSTPTQTP